MLFLRMVPRICNVIRSGGYRRVHLYRRSSGGASYHLGYVLGRAGLAKLPAEVYGGYLNQKHASDPKNHNIDIQGSYGLSTSNEANIEKGYVDARQSPPSPAWDYPMTNELQSPSPTNPFGGGDLGVGDWRFGVSRINSSKPFEPVPPLQTDSNPRPSLVPVPIDPTAPTEVGGWLSSMAGVDPHDPARPAPQPMDGQLSPFLDKGPPWTLLKRRQL